MVDSILTAMTSPRLPGFIQNTADGTPYKTDVNVLVYVKAQHVTEMTALGYAAASVANVPPGQPLALDQGW